MLHEVIRLKPTQWEVKRIRKWLEKKMSHKCPFTASSTYVLSPSIEQPKCAMEARMLYPLCDAWFPKLRQHPHSTCPCHVYTLEEVVATAMEILGEGGEEMYHRKVIKLTYHDPTMREDKEAVAWLREIEREINEEIGRLVSQMTPNEVDVTWRE